uniref:F-box domain-containing protein n=1 Tax=Psilocybe cubensis TaxID=181762 RepID=A0A8H7XND0_PSICU
MARSIEILPLEIIEDIIALLSDFDRSVSTKPTSLQTCSLVCHAFVPLCQKHIFHSIALRYAAQKSSFVKLINKNPQILGYVRNILYMVAPEDSRLEIACPISFFDILKSFKNLEKVMVSFQYQRQDWNNLSEVMRSVVLSLIHNPSVSTVGLAHIYEFDCTTLLLCPNIQELRLQNIMCPQFVISSTSTAAYRSIKPRLLEITSCIQMLNVHYDVGAAIFDLGELKHIELGPCTLFPASNILKTVKTLESALVSINLASVDDSEVFISLLMGSSKTLKRLTLEPSHITLTRNYYNLLTSIGEVLKKLSGQNIISTLNIELYAIFGPEPESTIGEEWNIFDQVLLTPGWSSLREFNLTIEDSRGEIIMRALRSLHQTYLHGLATSETVNFNFEVVDIFENL